MNDALFDRKAHWELVYRDKSPLEVSWYQQEPALSLAFIHKSGLALDEAIIDVGGGASLLVDCLLGLAYSQVSVLDISGQALAKSKERLGPVGQQVQWIESDITGFAPSKHYALWHDRAVFHFLTTAADRAAYIRSLKQGLRPGGYLILAAFALNGPAQCSGLDIVQYDADSLLAELGEGFELLEQAEELHQTPSGKQQQFGYYWLRRTLA
jgi:SAM-dependent methyltransferase